MAKKMLIDATHPEETRVVVVDGNKVEDFDFESINKRQLAGNIYLAKVTRVEPSLQAAFVEYGGNRHGFLAFSEIHPDYYQIPIADREALLAEEEREEEERRVQEEASEVAEKPRRGRKRRSRKDRDGEGSESTAQDAAGTAAVAVAGLEVIDVEGGGASDDANADDPSVPRGLEIAEPDAAAPDFGAETVTADAAESTAEPEVEEASASEADTESSESPAEPEATETPEPAEAAEETPAPEAAAPQVDAEVSEPEAETTPASEETATEDAGDDAADAPASDEPVSDDTPQAPADVTDDSDSPVKTVSESAGLDDDERVTEEIDAAGVARNRKPQAEDSESDQPDASVDDATEDDAPAEVSAEEAEPSEPEAPAAETQQAATEEQADATGTETPEAGETITDIRDEPEQVAARETAEATASDDSPADAAPDTAEAVAPAEVAPADDTAIGDVDTSRPESSDQPAAEPETAETSTTDADATPETEDDGDSDEDKPRRSRRRRRSRSKRKSDEDTTQTTEEDGSSNGGNSDDDDDDDDDIDEVGAEDVQEEVAANRTRLRRKYKIQDVVKVRQIMLVQVVKEERGNKGAALTTYLSLAGRYCVLMPNTARGGGISRKIVNASDRKRLREITAELEVPKGMGLIVRTAGAERTRPEIKRDYEFLTRQWEQIRDLTLKSVAPTLIYEEGSLIKRSIRDIYSKDIDQILVEGEEGYREAKEYMKMLMPSHAKNVQPYSDPIPLFSRYQVESYLNGMFDPTVQLKSGGYIVIGVTEALVAIDVNSGRATKQGSIEETALQTNLEAADEVARQLRLRDLAGLIVIDFIDMDENRNNRAVEKRMKDRLKTDRARIQVGRISGFGLMEMSRQRLRPGMLEATTQMCPTCQGMGLVRSDESLTLSILREVEEEGVRSRANQITIKVPVPIANYLINHKRDTLAQIEERHGISVAIMADPLLSSPDYEVERSKTAIQRPERQSAVVTSSSVVSDDDLVEDAEVVEDREDDEGRNRKRRGKRGGRRRRAEDRDDDQNRTEEGQDSPEDGESPEASGDEDSNGERKRSRRGGRRKRGGRNRRGGDNDQSESQSSEAMAVVEPDGGSEADPSDDTASDAMETADAQQEPDAGNTQVAVAAEASGLADPETTEAGDPAQADPDSVAADASADTVTGDAVAGEEQAAGEPEPVEAKSEPDAPAEQPQEQSEPDAISEEPKTVVSVEPETAEPEGPPKPKRRGWWSFGR